jgi:hypothetical protein
VAAKSGLHLPADWSDLVKVSMKFLTVAAYAFKAISFLFCILCAVAMVQKQTFFFSSFLLSLRVLTSTLPFQFFFFFEFFVHVSVSFKTGKRFKFLGFNSGTKT